MTFNVPRFSHVRKSCTKYLYYNIVKNKNQQTIKVDFLTKSVKNGNIVM